MTARGLLVRIAILALATAAAPSAGAVDTLRCGNSLIDPGMSKAEVEAKCGKPDHTEMERVPVLARNSAGAAIRIGETTIERWTYQRGRRLPARLTFEDGRLERIELLTRP